MIQIRKNVFETNSSSTHSLCICTEDEYNKWQKGELLYDRWSDKFATKEQINALQGKIDDLTAKYEELSRPAVEKPKTTSKKVKEVDE